MGGFAPFISGLVGGYADVHASKAKQAHETDLQNRGNRVKLIQSMIDSPNFNQEQLPAALSMLDETLSGGGSGGSGKPAKAGKGGGLAQLFGGLLPPKPAAVSPLDTSRFMLTPKQTQERADQQFQHNQSLKRTATIEDATARGTVERQQNTLEDARKRAEQSQELTNEMMRLNGGHGGTLEEARYNLTGRRPLASLQTQPQPRPDLQTVDAEGNPITIRYNPDGSEMGRFRRYVEPPSQPAAENPNAVLGAAELARLIDPKTGKNPPFGTTRAEAKGFAIKPEAAARDNMGMEGPVKLLKPNDQGYRIAQDLAYGKLTFPQFRSLMTSRSADAGAKRAIYDTAAELNPNFNPAAFEMSMKFASNPTTQRQLVAIDNVKRGVDDMIMLSDRASRTGIPLLNDLVIKGGVALGGKRYSNFNTAVTAFADELSLALGTGGATDMARRMGFDMTRKDLTPEQFAEGMTTVVIPFLQRRKDAMLQQMGPYGQPGFNPGAGGAEGQAPGQGQGQPPSAAASPGGRGGDPLGIR
jgi:hypothetical protein